MGGAVFKEPGLVAAVSRAFKIFSGGDPVSFAEFVTGAQIILTGSQGRRGGRFGRGSGGRRSRRGGFGHRLCRGGRGFSHRLCRGGRGGGYGLRRWRGGRGFRLCGRSGRSGGHCNGCRSRRSRLGGGGVSFRLGAVSRLLLVHSRQIFGWGRSFEETRLVAVVAGRLKVLAGVDPIAGAILLLAQAISVFRRNHRQRGCHRRIGCGRCRGGRVRLSRWSGRRLGVRGCFISINARDPGQARGHGHGSGQAERGKPAFVKGPGSVQFLSRRRAETVEQHDVSPERKNVSAALSGRNTGELGSAPPVRHCVRRTCATIRNKKTRLQS